MTQPREFGTVLKKLCEGKGIAQLRSADRSGVTRECFSPFEPGAWKNPAIDLVTRPAKGLGAPVGYLVE